jgi:hypothetical protein
VEQAEAVKAWLQQLCANARTVNDGEGEPLALKCEAALAWLALSGAEIARLHQVIHRLHCERDAAHAELARLAPYVQQLEQENKDLVARIGHPDAESTVAVPRLPEESHS